MTTRQSGQRPDSSDQPGSTSSATILGDAARRRLRRHPQPATSGPHCRPPTPPSEWEELRGWVEELCQRFAHLDHHVIPRCWWRHNEHVEALAALRDHERSSFSDTAPATAPVDWFRALRDISRCCAPGRQSSAAVRPTRALSRSSRPVERDEWQSFVTADTAARQAKEIEQAAR